MSDMKFVTGLGGIVPLLRRRYLWRYAETTSLPGAGLPQASPQRYHLCFVALQDCESIGSVQGRDEGRSPSCTDA